MGQWIDTLALDNPKIPSNILHALQSIKPSQLMDQTMWDFKALEQQLSAGPVSQDPIVLTEEDAAYDTEATD